MLLIDTYNVLHQWAGSPAETGAGDVAGLAGLISHSRYGGERVRLICDGVPPLNASESVHGCQVVYAGPGKDADGVIIHDIDRNSAPSRLIVVSSDRRIRAAAKRRGCESLPSGAFLAQIIRDSAFLGLKSRSVIEQPAIPLDSPSVAVWMREFGLEGTGLENLRSSFPVSDPPRATMPPVSGLPVKPPVPPLLSDRDAPEPSSESDPVLREALRMFRGLTLEDLDMARWLREHGEPRRKRSVENR